MRYKQKVLAHVEERVENTRETCDGCGKEIEQKDMYDGSEVEIGARLGDIYPEGDSRTVYEIDICRACFEAKVLPALAAVGLVFRERDAGSDDRAWEPEAPSPEAS